MRLTLPLLLCAAAFAQEQTRTYTFANTQDALNMQMMVHAVRTVAEVPKVSADPAQRTLIAGGTPDQLALVTWLFTELDRQASRPATVEIRDNTINDPNWPAVKIFYPAHLANAQQAQEMINGIRSIAEIQRCVALSGPGALIIRANPEQAAFAEWIVRELDGSLAGKRTAGRREYYYPESIIPMVERRATAARIYYPAGIATVQDLQEMINAIRSIADIQRAIGFSAAGAIVTRSTGQQAELTDWLVKELDENRAAPRDYRWGSESTVRAVGLSKNADLAATVAKLRQATGMQRVVALSRQRAIVMRGTPNQLAAAETVLK